MQYKVMTIMIDTTKSFNDAAPQTNEDYASWLLAGVVKHNCGHGRTSFPHAESFYNYDRDSWVHDDIGKHYFQSLGSESKQAFREAAGELDHLDEEKIIKQIKLLSEVDVLVGKHGNKTPISQYLIRDTQDTLARINAYAQHP